MGNYKGTAAAIACLQGAEDAEGPLYQLLANASRAESLAVAEALRNAYEQGAQDADRRAADLIARIFSRVVGIDTGMDADGIDNPSLRRAILQRGLSVLGL